MLAGAVLAAIFAPAVSAQQVTFSINEEQAGAAISPFIYGINGQQSAGQNLTFERAGGNRWTAYNYTNNASNAGSDYLFENDNYLGSVGKLSDTGKAGRRPISRFYVNSGLLRSAAMDSGPNRRDFGRECSRWSQSYGFLIAI